MKAETTKYETAKRTKEGLTVYMDRGGSFTVYDRDIEDFLDALAVVAGNGTEFYDVAGVHITNVARLEVGSESMEIDEEYVDSLIAIATD